MSRVDVEPVQASPTWRDLISDLQPRFLRSDHRNRADLTDDINAILTHTAIDPTAPYVRAPAASSAALQALASLSDAPQSREVVLAALAAVFNGQPKWHHPQVMHNVNPPPMLTAVAAAAVANLYNGNALWDYVSAGAIELEHSIVRQMARLARWSAGADGVFTFGGKGCLTYGIRLGLNRCRRTSPRDGLAQGGAAPVVITSDANHYSIDTVCSVLGIGSANCLRVRCKQDETVDLEALEDVIERALAAGHPIAAVVLSGGNTLDLCIDDVSAAVNIVEALSDKYKIGYRPYIYLDIVVGWPWLFFIEYDFKANPLAIGREVLHRLHKAATSLVPIERVDGFGVDFHKTGFCPYVTSLFVTKDGRELHSIHKAELSEFIRQPHGGNFLQHHTIEHTRSVAPIVAAWAAMQSAGANGYRAYLANGIAVADSLRSQLTVAQFELLNPFSLGFASVYAPMRPDDNRSYQVLLTASAMDIRDYNRYVFEFFHYLTDEADNGQTSFVLRFLPQYRIGTCGEAAAVIVVYPMAPELTDVEASKLGCTIGMIKASFDRHYPNCKRSAKVMPTHVPK